MVQKLFIYSYALSSMLSFRKPKFSWKRMAYFWQYFGKLINGNPSSQRYNEPRIMRKAQKLTWSLSKIMDLKFCQLVAYLYFFILQTGNTFSELTCAYSLSFSRILVLFRKSSIARKFCFTSIGRFWGDYCRDWHDPRTIENLKN